MRRGHLQRVLAINGAVFTLAAVVVTLGAVVLDRQSLGFLPQIASIAVIEIAVAAAYIPLAAHHSHRRAALALIVAVILVLGLPLLVPAHASATRFVVGLWSGVLLMKCIDLFVGGRRTVTEPRTAFAFLFASCLVLRNAQNPRHRREPLAQRLALSGAGTVLIVLAMRYDWTGKPFLLEHCVKLLFFAAATFPACNALMSVIRILGGTARDFSLAPALSRTPAEFWRRYNRIVGEFLHHDIARNLGGFRSPAVAVIAAFAFSAVLHEYLLAVAAGRVFGYQTAFFALQAFAVLATMRLAPRGVAGFAGRILTIGFMLLTATLFGANVHQAFPIYSNPLPGWLAW